MKVSVKVDTRQALAAFDAAEDVLRRHLNGAVKRGAEAIAEEQMRLAPKFDSALLNGIRVEPAGDLAWAVRQGTSYAAHVVLGTGPAAGRKKYYPNPDNLFQYLMTSPKARGFKRWSRSKKPGKDRGSQELNLWFRSRAFAWWIYQHGTRPQDYVTPAVEAKRDACVEFIRAASQRAFDETFGAGTVRFRR